MKKTLFLLITAFVFAVCLFACEGEKPDVSQDVSQTFSEAESSTSEASEEESRVYETSVPEISIPEISEPEESIPEEVIEKIDKYTTVSKIGEKTAATVFDPEFINEINAKREKGEVLALTDDEIKYIITNTIKLFEEYDIVRVYDKDGVLHSYRGLNFMLSEEYFNSFGILGKQTDASFDPAGDISKMLYIQADLLHTAIYDGFDYGSHWLLVTETPLTQKEWEDVQSTFCYTYEIDSVNEQRRAILKNFPFPAYYFDIDEKRVDHVPLVSAADISTQKSVYDRSMLPEYLGENKYDKSGKVAVVEIYDNETERLITRVRFDEQNNADEINRLFELWSNFIKSVGQDNDPARQGKYRAGVYLMGANVEGWNIDDDWAYVYCPDGDLNRSELMAQNVFLTTIFYQTGGQELNEYLNEMIKNYFE